MKIIKTYCGWTQRFCVLAFLLFFFITLESRALETNTRETLQLSGPGWKFLGVAKEQLLPDLGSEAFKNGMWKDVSIPHNFQTRETIDDITKGWYQRSLAIDPSLAGKELYLAFEGAASIADVFVNGQHLGQHRGAYTRFVLDATAAIHPGKDNELLVLVDISPASTTDLSFTVNKPLKILIMSTKRETSPNFATTFKRISGDSLWRDNNLQLVPAELFERDAMAGEKIRIALGDRDAVVMFKK